MIYFLIDTDLCQLFAPKITNPLLYYTDLESSALEGNYTHMHTHIPLILFPEETCNFSVLSLMHMRKCTKFL